MTENDENDVGPIWDDPRLHDFEFCSRGLVILRAKFTLVEEWVTDAEGKRTQQTVSNKFSRIHLPLSPAEWHELVQSDGQHYIGGCCASSSALQDKVCHLYRFNAGWVTAKDLSEIAERSIAHDDKESYFFAFPGMFESLKLMETISEKPELAHAQDEKEPWNTMACVYHLTRHHFAKSREFSAPRDHVSPVQQALYLVERGLTLVSWQHLFDSDKPPTASKKVNVSLALRKLQPSLKYLHDNLSSLDFGPLEGFAIIERAAGSDGIASNRLGLAIFETKQEAEKIVNEAPDPLAFGIRPVRVSKEDGIVFLDTNTKYDFKSKSAGE